MSPELYQRVRKLFDEALEHPESERLEFLKSACAGDQEAFEATSRLLAAHQPAQDLLEHSATTMMQRIGRYVITRELGRGGMGVVYQAMDPLIGRRVAIKVIHTGAFGGSGEAAFLRDRLFREARAAGQLFHPGIVTVLDVGQEGDLAFIAMELVEGTSLYNLLESGRRLDQAQGMQVLRQTAAALDFAHQHDIVHRDVKPANILIDPQGSAKLTDFGIAKVTSTQSHTRTGLVLGTPSYMSPEQVEGRDLDGRSDQFSLAIVGFELLTGAGPFRGDSLAGIAHAIVYGPRPSASAVNPQVPSGADAIFLRALSPAPADRFSTCSEFVRELDMALHGVPPPPPPPAPIETVNPSAVSRAGKQAPGNRTAGNRAAGNRAKFWVVGAAGVIVLGLAAAGAYRAGLIPGAGGPQPSSRAQSPPSAAPSPSPTPEPPASLTTSAPSQPPSLPSGPPSNAPASDTPKAAPAPPAAATPEPPRTPAPVVALFEGKPPSVQSGGTAILRWQVRDASQVKITPDIGMVGGSGSAQVRPRASTAYSLRASGPGGSATGQVRIAVEEAKAGTDQVAAPVDPKAALAALVKQAAAARSAGDAAKAFSLYLQAAEMGDAGAMAEAGNMYSDGVGTAKSYPNAMSWYSKGADRGNSQCMVALGSMYYLGSGIQKDYVRAAYWFQKASDAGNAAGKYDLGEMYESGLGVTRDVNRAKALYREAADLGDDEARRRLAALAAAK